MERHKNSRRKAPSLYNALAAEKRTGRAEGWKKLFHLTAGCDRINIVNAASSVRCDHGERSADAEAASAARRADERGARMDLFEIRDILNATVLCGEEYLDREVRSACASDFMSDVLAYVKDQALLLTGMVNPQVVRTAEMMDMKCIIFVRGKMPGEDILELAREREIVVMRSEMRMFIACGLLYSRGLAGE